MPAPRIPGTIANALAAKQSVVAGVSSSDIEALQGIDGNIQDQLDGLAAAQGGGAVAADDWATLDSLTAPDNTPGTVPATDTGEHEDPITSEIVPNSGIYRYVEGPPDTGWKRIGDAPATQPQVLAVTPFGALYQGDGDTGAIVFRGTNDNVGAALDEDGNTIPLNELEAAADPFQELPPARINSSGHLVLLTAGGEIVTTIPAGIEKLSQNYPVTQVRSLEGVSAYKLVSLRPSWTSPSPALMNRDGWLTIWGADKVTEVIIIWGQSNGTGRDGFTDDLDRMLRKQGEFEDYVLMPYIDGWGGDFRLGINTADGGDAAIFDPDDFNELVPMRSTIGVYNQTGEASIISAAEEMHRAIKTRVGARARIVVAGCVKGGAPYTALAKGQQYFTNVTLFLTKLTALEATAGRKVVVRVVFTEHGETDATRDTETMVTNYAQLSTDINTDWGGATGQQALIVLQHVQPSSGFMYQYAGAALAMLELALSAPARHQLCGPAYQYPYGFGGVDRLHRGATGHDMMGEDRVDALLRHPVGGANSFPVPFCVNENDCEWLNANTLRVGFQGIPTLPLVEGNGPYGEQVDWPSGVTVDPPSPYGAFGNVIKGFHVFQPGSAPGPDLLAVEKYGGDDHSVVIVFDGEKDDFHPDALLGIGMFGYPGTLEPLTGRQNIQYMPRVSFHDSSTEIYTATGAPRYKWPAHQLVAFANFAGP